MKSFPSAIGPAIALIVALVGWSPTSAQMNPVILAAPTSNSIAQVMKLRAEQMQKDLNGKRAASNASARGSEARNPSSASHRALGISSDPAISEKVHHAFIDELAKSGGQAQANTIDAMFGDIHSAFAGVVRPYGLTADNLGDVMTAHLIVLWMAANHQTSLPSPAQVQAVHRQMDRVFSSTSGAIADARQRQLVAEYLMYETCLAVLTGQQIQSNPKLVAAYADAANRKLLGQGISARDLGLTDRGLVRR